MPVPPPSDEARRADALALVARLPAAEEDWRTRAQRPMALVLRGLVLLAAACVVAALVAGSTGSGLPVPHWQWVSGLVISATGVVFDVVAAVASLPANRRLRAMDDALAPLGVERRRRLRATARGRAPVAGDDLVFARVQAEMLVLRPGPLLYLVGLGVFWVGAWVRSPGVVGGVLLACFAAGALAVWSVAVRDSERAVRFLAAHPDRQA